MQVHSITGRRCLLIGEQSLLAQCGQQLLQAGFSIVTVVSSDEQCIAWAAAESIPVVSWGENSLTKVLADVTFDLLLSITNLRLLPSDLITRPNTLAINFHDGPLPAMRGLNTPMWALLEGREQHAINWHLIVSELDRGPILVTETFPIDPDDTAFTLNAKCYAAGVQGFALVLGKLQSGQFETQTQPQVADERLYRAADRPDHAGFIHAGMSLAQMQRIVQALDTGPYLNPVTAAKFSLNGRMFALQSVQPADADHLEKSTCNTVLHAMVVQAEQRDLQSQQFDLQLIWDDQPLTFIRVKALDGQVVVPQDLVGQTVEPLSEQAVTEIAALARFMGTAEAHWVRESQYFEPTAFAYSEVAIQRDVKTLKLQMPATQLAPELVVLAYCAKLADQSQVAFALEADQSSASPACARLILPVKPVQLQFEDSLLPVQHHLLDHWQSVNMRAPLCIDTISRRRIDESLLRAPIVMMRTESRFSEWQQLPQYDGIAFYMDAQHQLHIAVAGGCVKPLQDIADEIHFFAEQVDTTPFADIALINQKQLAQIKAQACGHKLAFDLKNAHVLTQLKRQVITSPDATAVVFQRQSLTYSQLDHLAGKVAQRLQTLGVNQGDRVGLMLPRGLHLMPAMLGILYAGAAFVPMDPVYPSDRLEHMATDAGLDLILCEQPSALQISARQVSWSSLELELLEPLARPVLSDGLAYMIYTSGSSGRPKGVMVEHGQLANFCEAMTRVIPGVAQQDQRGAGSAWLAVTSISFDISILELLWTLCQGMKLVIYDGADLQPGGAKSQASEQTGSNPQHQSRQDLQHLAKPVDFSLFYWNLATHDDVPGAERYRVLLDGARYGDQNGFKAVWTPERHFGEFGGLYPNPAVSSAAVATITDTIQIRAGSCVVPLHHPIRVAEDWAMVDNLSNGRVGLSAAAGWMPDDFVILPKNFENAKEKMFSSLEQIRKLWRGETVSFPGPKGDVAVRTLPRPVQPELPVWVTTAGNPENFRIAGELGLNLLTHLLGQTPGELGEKIKIYHDAWRKAGHAGQGLVSLMLHTFIAETDAEAKAIAREPMKNYLKTALFLVKSAAWEFPTFKQLSESQGKSLDEYFATISEEDMDALLDFAFERYYTTSGLFGSPERCIRMVDDLKGIGVGEIACLIDYGIDTQKVLAHLPFIKQVMQASQPGQKPQQTIPAAAQETFGFAELMTRENITHFQCTPSMARLLMLDEEIKSSLTQLDAMLLGGEALPLDLAQTLASTIKGSLLNMYGPTETTIWSSVDQMTPQPAAVSLGQPIANTQLVVMNSRQQPVPVGCVGELFIGGAGVVPGYWQRPDLTSERFVADTLGWSSTGRWYRTGDLVRYVNGRLVYLGRNDFQVKIRGYRIELGEIESKLLALDGVREAVVSAVVTQRSSEPRLVGYYTLEKDATLDADDLRAHLAISLASFMVPSVFMRLDAMPLTPNAKIDRARLPVPQAKSLSHAWSGRPASSPATELAGNAGEANESNSQTADTAGSSETEQLVLSIWQEVLGVNDLRVDDNFFEKGGHSLLVVDVIARLKPLFSKPVRLVDFFRFPQVRALVNFLSKDDTQPQANTTVAAAQSRGAARRAARRGKS